MDERNIAQLTSVRFYAVSGAISARGGYAIGTTDFIVDGHRIVQEGDSVFYPDVTEASVLNDHSTGIELGDKCLTAACTGTMLSNGDELIRAGQKRMALFSYSNNSVSCGYIDSEEEYQALLEKGLIHE
ncbi:hypothetical protein [Pantoea agglomerans]|uniref:Uncharacterized protein n=1 Tax=Enterobacter agglomerans TaxID=549 RepID=A0ACC5RTD8_ENTAG|nr:hypothetical protein [Pantoea agglomerans]MBK4727603.1 hypothetical protein [Pantoea agglomerans]